MTVYYHVLEFMGPNLNQVELEAMFSVGLVCLSVSNITYGLRRNFVEGSGVVKGASN